MAPIIIRLGFVIRLKFQDITREKEMLFLNPSHEDGVVMENPSAGLSHPRLMIGLPFFLFF